MQSFVNLVLEQQCILVTKVFCSVKLELSNKAPDDSAQMLMYIKGLKPAVKTQVNLTYPQLLIKAEQLVERANAALF